MTPTTRKLLLKKYTIDQQEEAMFQRICEWCRSDVLWFYWPSEAEYSAYLSLLLAPHRTHTSFFPVRKFTRADTAAVFSMTKVSAALANRESHPSLR